MIILTGANGQLATEFKKALESMGKEFRAFSRDELDITDFELVMGVFKQLKPEVVINCAAYNLVDKAEEEIEKAYLVNAVGVCNLVTASQEVKARFVHFGTDYVFDGKKENGLYTESDKPAPLSEYGKSKLLGERLALRYDKSLVLRVSWVYGHGKQNFIHKLLTWAKNFEYLKISCDEFSVPTSTQTIVDLTLKALDRGIFGLYHAVSSGFASRFEWAREVFDILSIDKFIKPVSMDEFSLPAKRPKFSAMSNLKLSKELSVDIPSWKESLRKFLS